MRNNISTTEAFALLALWHRDGLGLGAGNGKTEPMLKLQHVPVDLSPAVAVS